MKVVGKFLGNTKWDKFTHISSKPGDLFDDPGAKIGITVLGHEENGFDFRFKASIHQGKLKFKFKVGYGPQASDNGGGFFPKRVVNEQAIEVAYSNPFFISKIGDGALYHDNSFFHREKVLFRLVCGDGDGYFVKEPQGTAEDIKVAIGDGVKASGIDGFSHHSRGVQYKGVGQM